MRNQRTLCDQFTSQVLIGHGCFLEYFKRVNLATDSLCIKCKNKIDSPEHVLFECDSGYAKVLKRMGITKKEDLWKILGDKENSNENIEIFKDLCKIIITDRNTLINNCPKMKLENAPAKGKKPNKTNNFSKLKRIEALPLRNGPANVQSEKISKEKLVKKITSQRKQSVSVTKLKPENKTEKDQIRKSRCERGIRCKCKIQNIFPQLDL